MRLSPGSAQVHLYPGVFMKRVSLIAILAVLAACTNGPTQPDIQSTLRLSRVPGNPAGTGQPGAECGEDNALTEPNGFGTDGFGNAEAKYAGSDGTASLANANSEAAVSQYDVACYQISNR